MVLALLSSGCPFAFGQTWDVAERGAKALDGATEGKLTTSFEFRTRFEDRTGMSFGADPDLSTFLIRTRLGIAYKPFEWLKFSGMVQDSRAPLYGPVSPTSARDEADLQEGYFEIRPNAKTGIGASAGRRMVSYGEGRLIGVPQWSNTSRTYDFASARYGFPILQTEFLVVSPVKIRQCEFNRPVLGDRVWGTYNTLTNFWRGMSADLYVLRHDQNRPGGFTTGKQALGTDSLAVDTFGFRLTGPLVAGAKYSIEGVKQTGRIGAAKQGAEAWFSGITRRWKLSGKSFLDASVEYKYASGTANPSKLQHSGTFDQLYSANHDKFGHEDLFGWKNVHNIRSLETVGLTKSLSLNFMYDNFWLASARDALYNGQGKAIAKSATGAAGRHVGQETDLFATYKWQHWVFGAGGGYFYKGEFIQKTTPAASPTYLYVFQTYSF